MVCNIISSKSLRLTVAGCSAMVWISSIVVVGITGYFLNEYPHDQHLIFEICISALVLGFWIPSFILPLSSTYRFCYAPLNFICSYLWLTAFVFAAQDYNESEAKYNAPFDGSCNLKFANEAFIFLALLFSVVSFGMDAYAYKAAAVVAAGPVHPEKAAGVPNVV